MKLCRKCGVEKPLAFFGEHSRNADGLRYQCKACENMAAKVNGAKEEAQLLRKQSQQKYRASEKGSLVRKAHDVQYRKTAHRKEYLKAYTKDYFANRMQADPLFKLACKTRKLLNIGVKKQGFSKNSKTANVLGCDFEFFQLYLEMQFAPDMCWDNFGEWHIDHVYPIAQAKTIEEFNALNHFMNFQPMWARYNIIKSDMLPEEWEAYVTKHGIDVNAKPNIQADYGAV